ncbi:MAG: alpha/beta fold hydrolase [Vicinamibacterales bacterium]
MSLSFVPRAGLSNGHWMTLYSWGNPRQFPRLPEPTVRYFSPAPETQVLAHCHWHDDARSRLTLILLHGLNGSSDAHYMKGLADKAFARGMNVVRLNQRNCGNTEHLAPGLFHSGLTADAKHVIEELTTVDGIGRIAVAGYSLGGNLALRLAGEYGVEAPTQLVGVAAVSPILEIGECVLALERKSNWMYQWNFVRGLKNRIRRKVALRPGSFDLDKLTMVRSVRDFDQLYTAPHFGFLDATDYYHRASAMRVVDRITIPALIITAEDDPFVPSAPFRHTAVTGNPHITLAISAHGGHCGFIGPRNTPDHGYWAERTIVDFIGALPST